MNNLTELKWLDASGVEGVHCKKTNSYIKDALWFCSTLVADYVIKCDEHTGRYIVNYGGRTENEYDTVEEAKHWCEHTHYASKMQPYVKPDSITDIANWFKAAKPEPTAKDACTQMGCHFEEVAEMATAIRAHNSADIISEIGDLLKSALPQSAENYLNKSDHIELLDALCDQIVTATGVAYMMGFDIDGALKEVIRSNNSKMVDGKFTFDDNGKIQKPSTFSYPDLTPFLNKGY